MTLLKEESDSFTFSNALLLFGLFGALVTAKRYFDNEYFGQKVVYTTSIVSKAPRYFVGGKGTLKVVFNVDDFYCELLISNSALSDFIQIFPNQEASFTVGDTITFAIAEEFQELAKTPGKNILVWALKVGDKVILDPNKIEKDNRKFLTKGFSLTIPAILLGMVLKIRNKVRERMLQ